MLVPQRLRRQRRVADTAIIARVLEGGLRGGIGERARQFRRRRIFHLSISPIHPWNSSESKFP